VREVGYGLSLEGASAADLVKATQAESKQAESKQGKSEPVVQKRDQKGKVA